MSLMHTSLTHTIAEADIAGLGLPHTHANDPVRRLLGAALGQRGDRRPSAAPHFCYWDAVFFDLHRVTLYQTATPEEQAAMLCLANQSLLEEAYLIEKAGVGYMAKMVLLADSLEERMLYSLFTADETTHLSQLTSFLPDREPAASPFLQLLTEVVESCDKTMLLFVIQVVLEGWGLSHYRRLSKNCRDRALAELLTSFLQAEARHHGAGFTLFNQSVVSPASHAAIVEVLATFLHMVQIGPQGVLAAIEQVKGHLSRSQKIQVLEELQTEIYSGTRLQLLRSLIQKESAGAIGQTLTERGAFIPFAAAHCVL